MALSLPTKTELRILTPVGMLGYGFSEQIFWEAIENGVDAIILDSGSTDSGPSKLALGGTTVPREGYERDLAILVEACHSHRVPILIGSAGGDGENAHVDMFVEIITKLISNNGYRSMNVLSIYAEVSKDLVRQKLDDGLISPCGKAVPQLLATDVDDSTRIVAQMGHEPYLQAMHDHPDFDIIVGGRAYDPAPYAAFCIYHGFEDLGIAYGMGKIMECGALCSTPKSREALAIVRHDSFDIVPLDPKSRCTVVSVAAHFLYEKTRPDILHGPGGALLLADARYEQLPDDRTVRIRGSHFQPEEQGRYTVKLEGARAVGYFSVFIGAIRDPILLSQLDSFISQITSAVKQKMPFDYDIKVHVYGQSGVMGRLEPDTTSIPKEVGICVQVRAATQAQANQVVNITRIHFVHAPYQNQLATAGNFAWPFTPCDIPMGPLSEFCIYHIMPISNPLELFPIKLQKLDGDASREPRKASPKLDANPSVTKTNVAKDRRSKIYFLTPEPAAGTCYLGDVASIIRSKNAGPYELTFDVMFDDDDTYAKVKGCGILSQATVARLYHIDEEDVIASLFWDPARAFKATIKRSSVSGAFGETDTHGSQQHVPFLYLALPFGRQSPAGEIQAGVALESGAKFANQPSDKPASGIFQRLLNWILKKLAGGFHANGLE